MGGEVRIDPLDPHGPIWIRCEGSGCPPCGSTRDGWHLCSMCGAPQGNLTMTTNGLVGVHYRDDILARIARGDFDEPAPTVDADSQAGWIDWPEADYDDD